MTKIINNINFEEFKNIMNKNKDDIKRDNEEIDKELLSLEGLNIPDKCLICEEPLYIDNIKKKNEKKDYNSEVSDGMIIESSVNEDNEKNEKQEYIIQCKVCKSPFHMICLARYELEKNNDLLNLIPKKADCFVCGKSLIWSDWVKEFTDQYNNK